MIEPRQLERWSSDVTKRIDELGRHVNDLRRFQAEMNYEKQIESAHRLIERLQGHATSYTNLIIAAGYAGFFALWTTLYKNLPQWLYALSGLLIVLSLLFFL